MKFLDRIRNAFTEEVEEDEIVEKKEKKPVKNNEVKQDKTSFRRENRQVKESIKIPKNDTNSNKLRESRLFQKEDNDNDYKNHLDNEEKHKISESSNDKFVFPVYFDDKDFIDLEKKSKPSENNKIEKEVVKSEPYGGVKIKTELEPKKVFKPSPIISPVYGVLDKNYYKDDISIKSDKSSVSRSRVSEKLTIDDIRNKAYGTLEEELESNLDYEPMVEKEQKSYETDSDTLDIFKELDFDVLDEKEEKFKTLEENELFKETKSIEEETAELTRQLEEQKKKLEEINVYIEENKDKLREDINKNEDEVDEKIDDSSDDDIVQDDEGLNDSELFNLIDSMYEKRDE